MKIWVYKDINVSSIDEIINISCIDSNPVGFIYIITNKVNGKIYIGRKSFTATKKTALGKRALASMTDKRGSKNKTVIKHSNWSNYSGSNKHLNEDIKNGDGVNREIIHLCYTKKQMTYWELYYQIQYDVLREKSYNDNILGKFFRSDLLTN